MLGARRCERGEVGSCAVRPEGLRKVLGGSGGYSEPVRDLDPVRERRVGETDRSSGAGLRVEGALLCSLCCYLTVSTEGQVEQGRERRTARAVTVLRDSLSTAETTDFWCLEGVPLSCECARRE